MLVYHLMTFDHASRTSTAEPLTRDEDAARGWLARKAEIVASAEGLEAWPDPDLYRRHRSVASISLADARGEYVTSYSLKGIEQHCPTCRCTP